MSKTKLYALLLMAMSIIISCSVVWAYYRQEIPKSPPTRAKQVLNIIDYHSVDISKVLEYIV